MEDASNTPSIFTQLNRDCHRLILGHVALTKIKCIPIVIYLSRIVSSSGFITARDQSMVGIGVTEGGKTLPVFFFVNEHNNIHNNTNMKPQAKKQKIFKVIPEEKQQLVEEKDADNIRKVLFKPFIQWF